MHSAQLVELCLVHSGYSMSTCFVGLVAIITFVLQPGQCYLRQRVNVNLKYKVMGGGGCCKGPCDNKKDNLNDRSV